MEHDFITCSCRDTETGKEVFTTVDRLHPGRYIPLNKERE
jgi:hypothetical protein